MLHYLRDDTELTLGDVTSVNLTAMSGGVQQNFVPDRFKVGFDVRVAPTADLAELEAAVAKWVEEVRVHLWACVRVYSTYI